jgi:hypothetical protein
MSADQRRWLWVGLLALAGCGGTLVSISIPPMPDPPPSRFESFDDWNARVNPATTQASTKPATQP